MPLTVALVASGTNAGVRTSPWAVRRTPARAREPASRAVIVRAARRACVEARGALALATFLDVAENIGYPLMFAADRDRVDGDPAAGRDGADHGAIVASSGRLEIEVVIAVAAAAAILGDNVGFAIGRKLGRRALTTPGPLLHHRRRVIAVGEPFFDRTGRRRSSSGAGSPGCESPRHGWPGSTRMSWPTFLFWNALGGIAWATSIALLAFFVGHSAEKFIHLAGLGGAAVVVPAGSRCGSFCGYGRAACGGARRGRARGGGRRTQEAGRSRRSPAAGGRWRLRPRGWTPRTRPVRPRARAEHGPQAGRREVPTLRRPRWRRGAADLDGDAARLALLGLGDANVEHTVVEVGGDRLGVDALGSVSERRNEPYERSTRT